jgi:hypothetical protein
MFFAQTNPVESAIAQVAAPQPAAQTLPSPPPVVEWGILFGGVVWVVRQLVEQYRSKESAETDMMGQLIKAQQQFLEKLLEDARASRAELIEQIQLKDTVSQMVSLTRDDVQRALSSQTRLYTESIERLAILSQNTDAVHRRIDEVKGLLTADNVPHNGNDR